MFYQLLSEFILNAVQGTETDDRSIDLLLQLFGRHDFNIPAAELAGQTDILATSPNGQRQLVFTHQHNRTPQHVAQENLVNVRGLQCVGDQCLGIFAPAHDVDPFTCQFVHNVLDAIAAYAHTSADAIHPLVRTAHRDLAAVAGLARHGIDGDHAVGDFRYLLLEQPAHQTGATTAQHHLHATALGLHLVDDRSNSFVRMMRFAGNLFAAW